MKLFTNADVTLPIWDNNLTSTQTEIKNHEPLLYKIAINFRFDDNETCNLVHQVYADANKDNAEQETYFTRRINLSKIMIHKCIFIISSKLFSINMGGHNSTLSLDYYAEYKSSCEKRSLNVPLSYRAAFILKNNIGFTEAEISELLNITPIKVKERLNKARYFINNL